MGSSFLFQNSSSQCGRGLTAGTYNYRVAYGVVDVDSVDRSSALLIDDFTVQQVPFKFSPTAGIALVLGLFGCDQLRRRMKMKIRSGRGSLAKIY